MKTGSSFLLGILAFCLFLGESNLPGSAKPAVPAGVILVKEQSADSGMTTAPEAGLGERTEEVLTDDEKALAKRLNYDEKVLLLIKQSLHPRMGFARSGGLLNPDTSFLDCGDITGFPLPSSSLDYYKGLFRQYPILRDLLDQKYQQQISVRETESAGGSKSESELDRRRQRFEREAEQYLAVIMQESQPALPGNRRMVEGGSPPGEEDYLASDEALDKKLSMLKAAASGKELRPENRSVDYLGLRYLEPSLFPNGGSQMHSPSDELIKLGYRISVEPKLAAHSLDFSSREDAEKYLRFLGSDFDSACIEECPASVFEFLFPGDDLEVKASSGMITSVLRKVDEKSEAKTPISVRPVLGGAAWVGADSLQIPPGAKVSRVGSSRWRVEAPAGFRIWVFKRVASLIKVGQDAPGYEVVRAACTRGYKPNTEDIVAKLKEWDKKYGVVIVNASSKEVLVRLKNPPQDPNQLIEEVAAFCEDEGLRQHPQRFLTRLERLHEVALYWD